MLTCNETVEQKWYISSKFGAIVFNDRNPIYSRRRRTKVGLLLKSLFIIYKYRNWDLKIPSCRKCITVEHHCFKSINSVLRDS